MTDVPIPASCADRPVVGGLVAPWVNLRLADGGVDYRSPHHTTYAKSWTERRCQVCAAQLGKPAILFGGPNQVAAGSFDEPPMCVPCALYASRACPMVSGRQARYADRDRVAQGHRGKTCPDPDCGCGGWTETDPNHVDSSGEPAHPWYAVYIHPAGYDVTAHTVRIRCSDKGCLHDRIIVNGGQLNAPPLKVVHIATYGAGRVWKTLPMQEWPTETCARPASAEAENRVQNHGR